ncbi:transposase [Bradyrhizobium niftali]
MTGSMCRFIEGPIDGVSFRTYVEKVLLPTLQPGDIVVLDNLGSHRSKVIRELIRSAGAELVFLPKYSPDLNPIEQVFAKLRHLVRKAAARAVDAVWAAIGHALDAFSEECANYLENSGYHALSAGILHDPSRTEHPACLHFQAGGALLSGIGLFTECARGNDLSANRDRPVAVNPRG